MICYIDLIGLIGNVNFAFENIQFQIFPYDLGFRRSGFLLKVSIIIFKTNDDSQDDLKDAPIQIAESYFVIVHQS